MAALIAEHARQESLLYSGTSSLPELRAGHVFSVSDTTGNGVGGTLLATRVDHVVLLDETRGWVRGAQAIGQLGTAQVPEVGDEVLVSFEQGRRSAACRDRHALDRRESDALTRRLPPVEVPSERVTFAAPAPPREDCGLTAANGSEMSADPSDEQDYRDSHTGEGKGEQYDRHYALDAWQAFMWQREQRVIDELLQRHLGGREIDLLDFACGSGRITSFLESRVTRCTGIDLSDSMLDVARGKLERTQLIKADLTRENALGERKFDLITAFRFFTNAQPELRTAVIDRLAQHLAPDGFLLFNNHHIPAAMYFRAQNLLASIRGRSRQPSFRMMTLPETLDLVKSAGLELVELRHVGFLHLPRINFPGPLLNAVDQIAERVGWAARRCESVMVLCRR